MLAWMNTLLDLHTNTTRLSSQYSSSEEENMLILEPVDPLQFEVESHVSMSGFPPNVVVSLQIQSTPPPTTASHLARSLDVFKSKQLDFMATQSWQIDHMQSYLKKMCQQLRKVAHTERVAEGTRIRMATTLYTRLGKMSQALRAQTNAIRTQNQSIVAQTEAIRAQASALLSVHTQTYT